MVRRHSFLAAMGLPLLAANIAAAQGGSGEQYFNSWISNGWKGPGWYVTDPSRNGPVPLKGPFGSSPYCMQTLPNSSNPAAESHRWYCQYFSTNPFP